MHQSPPPSTPPWPPAPAPNPPSPRRGRPWLLVAGAALVLVVLVGLVAAVTSGGDDSPATQPAASSSASASPSRPPAPTARQIAARLGKLYPLPNPTDNTGSCAAKPGDTAKGCKQLITTDSVSIYEFEDAATAARWVKTMRANGDWRRAGRYALAWTARDQRFTSQEARQKMLAEVRKMISAS